MENIFHSINLFSTDIRCDAVDSKRRLNRKYHRMCESTCRAINIVFVRDAVLMLLDGKSRLNANWSK